MSKTITVDKTESRSVRFDSQEDEPSEQPPRRSRRNQGMNPEVPLDSMNLPLEGANELLARGSQEPSRGRQKQSRFRFWNRSADKDSESKETGSKEYPEKRGTLSDSEDKKKGAIKKLTFYRGRVTSYTSPSSQSSRSPSQERPRTGYRSSRTFNTEGAVDWGRATPFEVKSEQERTKPPRPTPPNWGKVSQDLSKRGFTELEQPLGGEQPPPYPSTGVWGPLGPPLRPSRSPFGLDDTFSSVPTIKPIPTAVTNSNPYDRLSRMMEEMPEHPNKVSLDKSKDGDVTLTPSLLGQSSSQVDPQGDSRNGKKALEQPPESAAEFAEHLMNKDRSASTPPPGGEEDGDDTTKTVDTVLRKPIENKSFSQIPEEAPQSNTRSSVGDSLFVTPNSRANYSAERSAHPLNGFHTVGSGSRLDLSHPETSIFNREDFNESSYAGEYTRTYTGTHVGQQHQFLNQCKRCGNLVEGRAKICIPCQKLQRESGSYIQGNTGEVNDESEQNQSNPSRFLSSMRMKIAGMKDQSRKNIDHVSAQRSEIVIQEINFFLHVLDLLGGPDSLENQMYRKLLLFNLREGDSSRLVPAMGLGKAVSLLDTIKPVTDLVWLGSFHKAVGQRRIPPRPLDHQSWVMLRDEVIQTWFDRLLILKRVLTDPSFTRWKDGVQTSCGPYVVARLENVEDRVETLLHHLDIMESLLMGFRTQPGIRGPAQQWIGKIGVHPPAEVKTEAHIAPSILWNMRLLEDACYGKELLKEDFEQDAHALFNLRAILISTLQGLTYVVSLFQDKKNSDIRNFVNVFILEVDFLTQNGIQKPSAWKDFHHSLDKWISESSMEEMLDLIDDWQVELHQTKDFRHARKPDPKPTNPQTARGSVDSDNRYHKEVQEEDEYMMSHPQYPHVATISKALTPFRPRGRNRGEYNDENDHRSRDTSGSRDRKREKSSPHWRWGSQERGRRDDQGDDRRPRDSGGGGPGGPPGPPGGGSDDDGSGDEDRRRSSKKDKCKNCGSDEHTTGDPRCPKRQKFCFLCQSFDHDYENCNHRKDAPPCKLCGGYPHNKPQDCPRWQQDQLRKEEDDFRRSSEEGQMTYANWKAKQTLGANLEGEYPKTRNIPYSEIGNKLRKQQLEEERREREEMKLTQLNHQRSHYAAAKASIEADEAEKILGSRHMSNLKPGEQLSQRQKESIAKHGDAVFTSHYQGLTKTTPVPQKEMTLEQRGFGPEVVFSGDPRGMDVKEFVRLFDSAKSDRNWDEGACAAVIAQRFRGPAKIWYDNFRLDPKTHVKSMFYIELKAALLQRFARKRDWFDKNRLFRDIRWDSYKYKGSVMSLWEEIKTRSFLYTEDWPETKLFSPAELRKFIATQHFFDVAPSGMIHHLLDKGVEDDPDAMEEEMKHQEALAYAKQSGRQGSTRRIDYSRDRMRVSAIENESENHESEPMYNTWEEPNEVEVDALKKKDGDGSNEGEDTKTCWHCNRPGHLRQNCPELKRGEKDKSRRPGDDGRFRNDEIPGFESEGHDKNWLGPPKTAALGRRSTQPQSQGRPTRRTRGRFTPIIRQKGSTKPTRFRKDRTYRSRRTRNTYKVASLGGFFAGEDGEIVGRLERVLVAGETGEDVDEEDEDDLQAIYSQSEVAELSRRTVENPLEETDHPEVAGMEEAPPMSLSETEGGYLFGTYGSGDTGEGFVPFRY